MKLSGTAIFNVYIEGRQSQCVLIPVDASLIQSDQSSTIAFAGMAVEDVVTAKLILSKLEETKAPLPAHYL